MTTGERIKLRRKEIGLSAEKVAEIVGVSPATIYRYEKGDIEKVPGDFLRPLAKALQTTPAYLMGWTSPGDELIGQRIKEAMDKEDISVRELSFRTGISEPELQRYLAGEDLAQISLPRLGDLADALHTTVAFLTSSGAFSTSLSKVRSTNSVVLTGRDGLVTHKELTDDQYALLLNLLGQITS